MAALRQVTGSVLYILFSPSQFVLVCAYVERHVNVLVRRNARDKVCWFQLKEVEI